MVIERVLEAVLIVVAIKTGLQVFQSHRPAGSREIPMLDLAREMRFPWAAVLVTALLLGGALTELFWPGALSALRTDPSSDQWWRTLTAPFVQEGVAGAVFNILTAAIVVALVEWYWGRLIAVGLWLVGAWAPISHLAQPVGYHVSLSNVTAYSAGSSGATYFAAGSLCVALLLSGVGRDRLLGLVGPAIAAAMWAAENDGHGVVFCEGAVIALVLWALVATVHAPTPFRRNIHAVTR